MPWSALAVPLATAGISALGNWLGGRSRRRPTYQMGDQQMGMPYGGTQMGGEFAPGRFTPQQQAMMEQMGTRGMHGLEALQQPDFAKIRKAAETRLYEDIIPGIAERFTGAGAQESGAFQQALGGAAAGMQERLAVMEQQLGMKQRGQEQSFLLSLLKGGLTPQIGQTGFGQTGFGPGMIPRGRGMGIQQEAGTIGPMINQALKILLPFLIKQYFGGGAQSGGAGLEGSALPGGGFGAEGFGGR